MPILRFRVASSSATGAPVADEPPGSAIWLGAATGRTASAARGPSPVARALRRRPIPVLGCRRWPRRCSSVTLGRTGRLAPVASFSRRVAGILADLVDPVGSVDRAEPGELDAGHEADRRGQRHRDLARVDTDRATDRNDAGGPDHDQLRAGRDLRDDLGGVDADHVVEHDDVGLCRRASTRRDRPQPPPRRRRRTRRSQHVAKGIPGRIPLPDDHTNAALIHPPAPAPASPRPGPAQRTCAAVPRLPTFGAPMAGEADLGR